MNLPEVDLKKAKSKKALFSVVIVMLATYTSPSFQRILGSRTWKLLGYTESQWSLYIAGRALIFIIFILAAGILGDLFGRRRLLLLTLAGLLTCLLVSIILPPGFITVALQTPLSILGTMIRALSVTMVILIAADKRERIRNLIIYSALAGGSSLLSPLLSAELLKSIDIKVLFIGPLILAIIGFWMVTKYIPESRASAELNWNDGFALAIWTFGICTLIFSGILLGSLGWADPIVLTGFAVGMVILLVINWLSRVSESKAWKFSLYYQQQLSTVIFAGVILNIALYAVLVQTFNFLYKVEAISPVAAGFGMAPILLGAILVGFLVNRVEARFGLRNTLVTSLIILSIPAFGLYILEPGLSYWAIMPFLVLLGFGFLLGNTPRLVLLNASVPLDLSATIQAIGSATVQLGSALAYSFILTLLEGFAQSAYVNLLSGSGYSEQIINARIAQLIAGGESFPLILQPGQQGRLLNVIDTILKEAYVTGVSDAMLILAAVCILSAGVVYIALPAQKNHNGG